MLLYPEGMIKTQRQRRRDPEALRRRATIADITADLERAFAAANLSGDVHALRDHGGGEKMAANPLVNSAQAARTPRPGPPLWLLFELTYRCPLHCAFCYNPTDFARNGTELGTEDWIRVLREARALGAVQLGLSGGEPLARDDLEVIVAEAHQLGFYTNLDHLRRGSERDAHANALKEAGLDHIQLSFQDSTQQMNDFLSSTRTFELKSKVAALIKQYDYPMVLNVVLHRLNIDHVEEILEMAQRLGADYVELANTQYYGWAWHNREQLLPSRAQVERAEANHAALSRARRTHACRFFLWCPTISRRRPKPCMNGLGLDLSDHHPGWHGAALPCRPHAARARVSRTCVKPASSRSGTTPQASIISAAMPG